MEEKKVIAECSYCGVKKEVIEINCNRKICAECAIELRDRQQGHYLPSAVNIHNNVKDRTSCRILAYAATGT